LKEKSLGRMYRRSFNRNHVKSYKWMHEMKPNVKAVKEQGQGVSKRARGLK
jgi:hypothetical protein